MSTGSPVFTVSAGQFEGPLDLLLSLIEERKMLVSDISLSAVADSFMQFVGRGRGLPVGETANFIAIAATLLLIKSRSLLPVLTLSDDEEGDVRDLETRLKLLEIIRRASLKLAARLARMYIGEGVRISDPLFTPSKDLTPVLLQSALCSALLCAPKKVVVDEIEVKKIVSLDEMIERLTARIQKAISMSFKEFAGGGDPREIVVGFLAMLELVKRGFAEVKQNAHFEDITIEYAGSTDTPRYE